MSILSKFLNEVASVMEVLNSEGQVSKSHPPLILIKVLRLNVRSIIKPVLFVSFMTAIIVAPLPFITSTNNGDYLQLIPLWIKVSKVGVLKAMNLLLKTTSATLIFTTLISYLGWRGLLEGLRGLKVPWELTFATGLHIKYIFVMVRCVNSMITAREAKVFNKGKLGIWKVLASIVGDLMLKGYERGYILEKAINARTFTRFSPRNGIRKLGLNELMLLTFTVIMLTVFTLIEVL